jgi:hypothetical protein
LVDINGQTQDLPIGDTVAGGGGSTPLFPPDFLYNSVQIVQTLADFPTPVGNEIFLLNIIYIIDGDIDISGYTLCFGAKTQVNGFAQNVSVIRSSTSGADINNKYVFFESSTNLFMNDLEIICEGTNQMVWEHVGNGTVPEGESFELNRLNLLSFPPGGPPLWGHNNQMGLIKDIRQGFIGTFSAFGFENGFQCAGAWAGGFRVQNTLFRVFSGIAFGSDPLDPVSFQLRMASNANLTIPLGSIGYDFPETACGFPAYDPKGNFRNNTGIQDTFPGGEWINQTDEVTTISDSNTWYLLELNTNNKGLTWFSELNGDFTYNSDTPLDVTILLTLSLVGKANDIVEVKLVKEDALAVQTDILSRNITIKGTISQGRAESVPIITTEKLVLNDKILVYVRNTSGISDVTTLIDSNCIIGAKCILIGEDTDPTPAGYLDKTTILDIGNTHQLIDRTGYVYVRNWVAALFYGKDPDIATAFGMLTTLEQREVCKYILMPLSVRTLFFTEAEDQQNWVLLVEKSKEYRAGKIEEMRIRVADGLRSETQTKQQLTDFFNDTRLKIESYIFNNDTELIDFINNKVGTPYENAGFLQASYYSEQMKTDLINIYNNN